MSIDRFGRKIHYLRISLTDHCNLRCVYCMPEEMVFRPSAELMQDHELVMLARLFASLGFDKFRLTGGEPTVRAHVVDLVREIAQNSRGKLAVDDHQWRAAGKIGAPTERSRAAAGECQH